MDAIAQAMSDGGFWMYIILFASIVAIGVIIERNYNTRDSLWEYTIMWTNTDITKFWTREKLKYARNKKQKTLE